MFVSMGRFVISALMITAILTGVPEAVTVDPATTYQTIEGIGVFPVVPTLFQKAGLFYMDRPTSWEYDRMCTDLGISGVRFQLATEGSYLARGKYDWNGIKGEIDFLKQCKARGVDRYIITILNPPGWAKTNGIPILGGYLLDAEYDGFAEYMAQMCKALKDSVGVEPYGLCVQNEPFFQEPYGSCQYSDENFSKLSTLAKQRLTALGLTTRLFAASDVCANYQNWSTTIKNTAIYASATHIACSDWNAVANYAKSNNKKAWETEWDIQPPGAPTTNYMTPGGSLMSGLKAGFSWWTWFTYNNNMGAGAHGTDLVDTMWVPDKRYYATKMFSRFIRRDAVRIGCTGGSANSAAFKNPDNTISVIFVNSGGATTESITGSGLPAVWHVYRTSATENCVYIGQSGGTDIQVPGASIVSVISDSKVPEIPPDPTPYHVAAPTPDMTVGQINARGDDMLRVWVNGAEVPLKEGTNYSVKYQVGLKQGDNVVACWIRNEAWGGGLLASMMLPGGDTLHSDGTWKVSIVDPTKNAAWNNTGFDDSGWKNAYPVGNVMSWPGFARWGSQAVNLYYQGAQCILGGDRVYFRKVITFSQAAQAIFIRGNNFKYKIYIDGEQKIVSADPNGTNFASCPGDRKCLEVVNSIITFDFAQGSTHCIAFDIEDAGKDGNGVLMKAGYILKTTPTKIFMDSTWWCSDQAPAGWNTVAYNDMTNWTHPRPIEAYDVGSGGGKFIYPSDFWFRRKFTSKEATHVVRMINDLLNRNTVASVKYFTLQGREITGNIRTLPMSIVLKRTKYTNGKVEQMRIMRTSPAAR